MAKTTRDDFVIRAIRTLRKGKQKGINSHAAGLAQAFSTFYGGKADIIRHAEKMAKAGNLEMRPNGKAGHFMLYLVGEAPPAKRTAGEVLQAMGLKQPKARTQVS